MLYTYPRCNHYMYISTYIRELVDSLCRGDPDMCMHQLSALLSSCPFCVKYDCWTSGVCMVRPVPTTSYDIFKI